MAPHRARPRCPDSSPCSRSSPALATAQASYVATNATVYTVDPAMPVAEAFAVQDGRFVAVGSLEAVLEDYPEWPRLDLGGQTVIPGLIDAHAHLLGLGEALLSADLVGSTSKADIVARLVAFAEDLPDGAWVTGRGWDQNDWGGDGAFPTRADLDDAFPDRPVWLGRVDGHAGWANTAALRAAGIDPDAPAPADMEGGAVIRDAQGRPTGVFVDAAEGLVAQAIPTPDAAFYAEALERALTETARYGLTGVHEAGIGSAVIGLYRDMAARGQLTIRNYAMITPGEIDVFCASYPNGIEDERLVVRSVKVYADGALGSRGAALLNDYTDDAGNHGLLFRQPDDLEGTVRAAMECGLQVNTHAIGDRANRVVLDAYESAIEATGGGPGRHRIEHSQILSLEDIQRFADLEVIASVQPTHATSDMPWAGDRLGDDRLEGAYAWRRLVDSGARLALGSDFPVERVSPMLGFYSAVTRQDGDGMPAGGWYGNQVLTRAEALRGFTLDAAYAGFMEDQVGSIEVGKRADFVVLSQDVMRVRPEAILDTEVVATYLDGEAIYRVE